MKLLFLILAVISSLLARCDIELPADAHGRLDVEAIRAMAQEGLPKHPPFVDDLVPDSPNAAARLILLIRSMDPELRSMAGWSSLNAGRFETSDSEYAPSPEQLRKSLEDNQPWIRDLIVLSTLDKFDTYQSPISYAAPLAPDDPRQQLGSGTRQGVRILRDDAYRSWADGRTDDAVDRICAIFRLAAMYRTRGPDLIDALVANSLVGYGLGAAATLEGASDTKLSEPQRRALLAALGRLDPDDPGGLFANWRTSSAQSIEFARAQLADGEIGFQLAATLIQSRGANAAVSNLISRLGMGGDGPPKPAADFADDPFGLQDPASMRRVYTAAIEALGVDYADLVAATERGAVLRERALAAWTTPHAAETLKEIQAEAETDDARLLEDLLMFPRSIHRSWKQTREQLQETRTRLASPPEADPAETP